MSRPVVNVNLSGVTSATNGEAVRTKGHYIGGMTIKANNFESSFDTLDVEVQASPNGSDWTHIEDGQNNQILQATGSGLDSNNLVFTSEAHIATEFVRLNITSFTDGSGSDLSVDGWLHLNGNNSGTGMGGTAH